MTGLGGVVTAEMSKGINRGPFKGKVVDLREKTGGKASILSYGITL